MEHNQKRKPKTKKTHQEERPPTHGITVQDKMQLIHSQAIHVCLRQNGPLRAEMKPEPMSPVPSARDCFLATCATPRSGGAVLARTRDELVTLFFQATAEAKEVEPRGKGRVLRVFFFPHRLATCKTQRLLKPKKNRRQ